MSRRAETTRKRPLAVWCNTGAVSFRRGDDSQRLGSHRGAAVRPLLHFSAAPGGLAADRPHRNVCADAHRLSQAARTRGHLSRCLCGPADAGRSFFSGQVPRHAPLDQVRSREHSAFGTGKARRHPLSGVVSGPEAPQQSANGILQRGFFSNHSSRGGADPDLRGPGALAARPGHRDRHRPRCHRHSLRRRSFLEMDCRRRSWPPFRCCIS